MKQEMSAYTAQDTAVWKRLFERQQENLPGKVSGEYLHALASMSDVLNANKIPDFREVDEWFRGTTGWQIEVVPGLIPVDEFFSLLSQKKFCSSTWLRSMEQLDYLEEPDMFHDTFGHIPLLSDPVFSDFMQRFGELGCRVSDDAEQLLALQRLYWFTIEFGMLAGNNPLIYGAGIISSFGETNRAVSGIPNLRPFVLEDVIALPFRTDVVQEEYICIGNFTDLTRSIDLLQQVWIPAVGV